MLDELSVKLLSVYYCVQSCPLLWTHQPAQLSTQRAQGSCALRPKYRPLPLTMCGYCFEAAATVCSIKRSNVRTAMPVGPFSRKGFASSPQAVPAMSRCAQE